MDRLALIVYRPLPPPLAGPWGAWLALLIGAIAVLLLAAMAAADLGQLPDADGLLSPIRWDSLPPGMA